jgi:hypothetical protein
MPGTTTKSRVNVGHDNGAMRDLALQHNKLIDDLETARVKMNAIITAAATSLAAVAAVPALATGTAAKIGDDSGTPVT